MLLIKYDAYSQHGLSDVVHLHVENQKLLICVVALIQLSKSTLDVLTLELLAAMLAEEAQNENWEETEDRQDDACENSVDPCPPVFVVCEFKLTCVDQAADQPDDVAFDRQAKCTFPEKVKSELFGCPSTAIYAFTWADAVVKSVKCWQTGKKDSKCSKVIQQQMVFKTDCLKLFGYRSTFCV